MWARGVEFGFYEAIRAWFRHSSPEMQPIEPLQLPQLAELSRRRAEQALSVLDGQLSRNEYIAGPDFSWADILLVTSLEGTGAGGFEIPRDCENVLRWYETTSQRESVVATRPRSSDGTTPASNTASAVKQSRSD